jgi:hypothetical protein
MHKAASSLYFQLHLKLLLPGAILLFSIMERMRLGLPRNRGIHRKVESDRPKMESKKDTYYLSY